MQLRVHTEPSQGASHDVLLRVARTAEDAGFDAFFRSDHYLKLGDVSGRPGPSDAWITLAALATQTRSIALGTLVSPVTFRSPGQLALQVGQVNHMAGGRVEVGIGTGWFAAEHEAYAIPFPDKRFPLLAEQLEIVTGLWATPEAGTYSYTGEHYRLTDALAPLKAASGTPPKIIVGGTGRSKTPALAARYADEFNTGFVDAATAAELYGLVREQCEIAGRPAGSMTYSIILTVCCGKDDAQVRARQEAIPEELPAASLRGTPSELVDLLGEYGERGVTRVYLRVLDLSDLDHLELIASEVMPQLGAA